MLLPNNIYLIFDFDGTMIDSFYCVIEKFNQLTDEFNFKKIPVEEIESLKNLTSREFIKYLHIPLSKIPRVITKIRKHLHAEMQFLLPFPNMVEVLPQINESGNSLGILTSNSLDNVKTWLKHNNMEHLFSFISNESSYFGKSHILKKILKKYKIDKSNAVYIGDETRDIEAAKQVGMRSVAVSWGFNSEETLLKFKPDYFLSKPADLLKIIEL